MPASGRLPRAVVAALDTGKALRIRAGDTHRFIGIWVVVVEGRAFVRSWSVAADGWYRAFRRAPAGAIQLGKRVLPIRAVPLRSARLQGAIDAAYLGKYATPGSRKYAVDLGRAKSRATTLELRPAS